MVALTTSAPARARASRRSRRTTLIAWGFATPFVILFLVFMAGPIVASLVMSFTDLTTRDLQTPFNVNLVGFENYANLFADPRFVRSLLNTFVFVIVGVPLTMAHRARGGARPEHGHREVPHGVPRRVLRAGRHVDRRDRDRVAVHPAARRPPERVPRLVRHQRARLAASPRRGRCRRSSSWRCGATSAPSW